MAGPRRPRNSGHHATGWTASPSNHGELLSPWERRRLQQRQRQWRARTLLEYLICASAQCHELRGVNFKFAVTRDNLIISAADQPTGPFFLQVHAGDLDGDGKPDDAVLKLRCEGNELREAQYLVVARESASGMPTGKRQHSPVTFVKEWSAATPQLMALRPT